MLQKDYVKMMVVREQILDLAEEQTMLRRARKSKLPKAEFDPIRKHFAPDKPWWDHLEAALEHSRRSTRITALLNLYHEMRNSPYRHGIPKGEKWFYEKQLEEVKATLTKLPKV